MAAESEGSRARVCARARHVSEQNGLPSHPRPDRMTAVTGETEEETGTPPPPHGDAVSRTSPRV